MARARRDGAASKCGFVDSGPRKNCLERVCSHTPQQQNVRGWPDRSVRVWCMSAGRGGCEVVSATGGDWKDARVLFFGGEGRGPSMYTTYQSNFAVCWVVVREVHAASMMYNGCFYDYMYCLHIHYVSGGGGPEGPMCLVASMPAQGTAAPHLFLFFCHHPSHLAGQANCASTHPMTHTHAHCPMPVAPAHAHAHACTHTLTRTHTPARCSGLAAGTPPPRPQQRTHVRTPPP